MPNEAPPEDPSVARPVRPLVSIVIPVYDEAALLREHTLLLLDYLGSLQSRFRFDIIIVNDGSRDESGAIAERLAFENDSIRVFNHRRNFGLGQALKTGFARCQGDYVIVLDIDFSYGPEHVGLLLDRIVSTGARMVLASPYMKGGSVLEVPWTRRVLSRVANRFLARASGHQLSTMTCMVRAIDGRFLRSLHLRNMGMDIMPEMIQKAKLLRASIEEVPAELNWRRQNRMGKRRRSSMRIVNQIVGTVTSGFMLRPFSFLLVPGLILLAMAAYMNTWLIIHVAEAYAELSTTGVPDVTVAVAMAYQSFPHTFIVGLLTLMLAVQLTGMAMLSLQNKKYFDELFHLGSAVLRNQREAQHAQVKNAESYKSELR
jgi:glycosyltransferase involved in cell wall biosynthesis